LGEAYITINGKPLTSAQSMTLRVAVQNFLFDLKYDGLGEDEHGRSMTRLYQDRLCEINDMISSRPTDEGFKH
jgi:hypothetical protein